jgi:phosphoribosylanthranilate isomerase
VSDHAVLVKICGVRTLEAAQAAVDTGADLLGFICYPPARRYVSPAQITAILAGLRGRSAVRAVGVFVNQAVEEMNAVASACGLDLIQLSGDEPMEVIKALNRPAIKAYRPEAMQHADPGRGRPPCLPFRIPAQRSQMEYGGGQARGPAPTSRLHAVLLEPSSAGWGGGGTLLDWRIARAVTDLPVRPPVFLAGGLTPENVGGAIAAVRPDGVDVSSGVEKNGAQDSARIAAFVAAAKGATA